MLVFRGLEIHTTKQCQGPFGQKLRASIFLLLAPCVGPCLALVWLWFRAVDFAPQQMGRCSVGCAGSRCKVQGTCHYGLSRQIASHTWDQARSRHPEYTSRACPCMGRTEVFKTRPQSQKTAQIVTELHGECFLQASCVFAQLR